MYLSVCMSSKGDKLVSTFKYVMSDMYDQSNPFILFFCNYIDLIPSSFFKLAKSTPLSTHYRV